MAVLRILQDDAEESVSFTPGLTVREILENAGIGLYFACGGAGICGRCLIRVCEGSVNNPDDKERSNLSVDPIRKGIRLACQTRVYGDACIAIENPIPKPKWKSLGKNGATLVTPRTSPVSVSSIAPDRYGVAVDLGSTQLRLSALELTTGRRIAARIGFNPQARYGADVLTRLMAATQSEKCAGKMSSLVKNAVMVALKDIFTGEGDIGGIEHVVIVGNTAMLSLLTKMNYDLLLQPENWMQAIDCRPKSIVTWNFSWGLDGKTSIDVAQPLAGFVGSDLMADVLATGLTSQTTGALLIDFGTNSEIALWDGEQLWVTSAAGGPAFEGGLISCGMPAEPGAIYRIIPELSSPQFSCEVIDGGRPKGICGSGLVDIIACLTETGLLKRNGRFSLGVGEKGFTVVKGENAIVLKTQDVDVFQRAKAAIGAGTEFLMRKAGMLAKDLHHIYVCGAFGQYLNPANAWKIGLLPDIPVQNIELCQDTALAGCEMVLLHPEISDLMESLKKKARIINLAGDREFEDLFMKNICLQPMHP